MNVEPQGRPATYVYPGQILTSATRELATTILGTCVSVCLFDSDKGLGGLNHFMLPVAPANADQASRFGDMATPQLASELVALGALRVRLRAKVFGGMAGRIATSTLTQDLGAKNVAVAMRCLAELGIPVVAEDVGGPKSRKLIFDTADGRAWVRRF